MSLNELTLSCVVTAVEPQSPTHTRMAVLKEGVNEKDSPMKLVVDVYSSASRPFEAPVVGSLVIVTGRMVAYKNESNQSRIAINTRSSNVLTVLDAVISQPEGENTLMIYPTLNRVTLVGRLGRDWETKYLSNGTVTKNGLCCKGRGESDDWFEIELWDKTAEVAIERTAKGKMIGITGILLINSWEDKTTGGMRYKPIIQVSELDLLVREEKRGVERDENNGQQSAQPVTQSTPTRQAAPAQQQLAGVGARQNYDDIPF